MTSYPVTVTRTKTEWRDVALAVTDSVFDDDLDPDVVDMIGNTLDTIELACKAHGAEYDVTVLFQGSEYDILTFGGWLKDGDDS